MKRMYIMLWLLISGLKQPGNDIDVYHSPLVKDLRNIWDEGVSMFDAHANEEFTLCAMLLCTVNNFLTYDNLSGYNKKEEKARSICIDDMESTWIPKCKNLYMHHRKSFLPRGHQYLKMKKMSNREVEDRVARRPLTSYEFYE